MVPVLKSGDVDRSVAQVESRVEAEENPCGRVGHGKWTGRGDREEIEFKQETVCLSLE